MIESVLKPNKITRIIIIIFLYIYTFGLFILLAIIIFDEKYITFVLYYLASLAIFLISYVICLIKVKERKLIHMLFIEISLA